MKYGFMIIILLIALPSCCLRKERTSKEEPMLIEEETIMPISGPGEDIGFVDIDTIDTTNAAVAPSATIDTSDADMALLQDEITAESDAIKE